MTDMNDAPTSSCLGMLQLGMLVQLGTVIQEQNSCQRAQFLFNGSYKNRSQWLFEPFCLHIFTIFNTYKSKTSMKIGVLYVLFWVGVK